MTRRRLKIDAYVLFNDKLCNNNDYKICFSGIYNKLGNKKTIDAITYVLSNNGFDVKTINETYGLVTTEWRSLDNAMANLGLTLLTASKYSSTTYTDSLQLTFNVKENGYTVIPKTMRTSYTSNAWTNTQSNSAATYPAADTTGGKLTSKVMKEIDELLGIESDIHWEEKEITVE